MSLYNPFIMANRNGIPRIEATGVNVGTTAVTYSFQRNAFYNRNFAGLIIFRLPAYTAPAAAVPVIFDTDGESQVVTTLGGVPVTSAELNQSGIYLGFYDGNVLQLLTGV
jgi:hypothetical protein